MNPESFLGPASALGAFSAHSGASSPHFFFASASSAFHPTPRALATRANISFFVASGFAAATSALTASRFWAL